MPNQDPARYFVDETDLGLGKALAAARAPVLHPGHAGLPEVPIGTLDPDWIPVVARLGLVVITRDRLRRAAEKQLLVSEGLRVIRIAAKQQLSTWGTVQLVAGSWDRIESHVKKFGAGPWAATIDSAGVIKEDAVIAALIARMVVADLESVAEQTK
jgi:hypothetical protein